MKPSLPDANAFARYRLLSSAREKQTQESATRTLQDAFARNQISSLSIATGSKSKLRHLAMKGAAAILLLLTSFFTSVAQTLTPSHTFVIEANTSSVYPTGYNGYGSLIFPNGKIGVPMNNNLYRLYEPTGTLVRTINLAAVAGFAPSKVIGLTNNRILLLRQTTFAIIDQQGALVLPETSVGLANYFNNINLDAAELTDGNLAFSNYNPQSASEVRVMPQAGAFVSGIINCKTTGTGRPAPINNQFYAGTLTACKDGGFIFVYRTYLMGLWAILFNNDGTMRTWPSTGLNHRKLSPGNEEYAEMYELPNGSFMMQLPYNKTANVIIDGNGNTVSTSVARAFTYGSIAINRKATNGYYVMATPDETIGQAWDGSDNYTGAGGLFAEARNLNGTQALPATQIGTGFFDVWWDEEYYGYWPDTRPGFYPVSSLRGGSGGYGLIVQNTTSGSNYSLTMQLYEIGSSTLPVKLESFTGKAVANGNLLEWNTSSEINADKFEIEYSAEGAQFSKIGEVPAGSRKYNFLHTGAAGSIAYYRLRIVDIDGKAEYSKVIKISKNTEKTGKVSLYPVPATDHCWIEISDLRSGSRLAYSIVSPAGAVLKKGLITQPKQKIQFSELKPGVYYLNIAEHETQKILVK